MSENYHIRLAKDYFVFSAAHFITFNGGICERLHGHNYRVEAEIFGPLDENQYVIDFIAARDALHALCLELDHHMLLPTGHPMIGVEVLHEGHEEGKEKEVEVTFEDRRWVFPREDCILLPVANTTTELLARYLGLRLLEELEQRTGQHPQRIRLAVDENFGQWGVCDLEEE